MALDLDPIFQTETMVKILREQGSNLYAMELAESILKKDPLNGSVKKILEELKAEARQAFERFRQGPKAEDNEELSSFEGGKSAEESGGGRSNSKIGLLKNLLTNVQDSRKKYEGS